MEGLAGDLATLGMLVLLQAVLGFDNLLYISLESQRAPKEKQGFVRKVGIGMAVALRIGLLFLIVTIIDKLTGPGYPVHLGEIFHASFNVHALIVLAGGVFIMYTSVKEVWHMIRIEADLHTDDEKTNRSVGQTIFWIVLMNLVFSFDSILSAIALTDTFWVMATAIVIGGILMIWLSDRVATFLQKNRMYEVLGLFILFVVGIMLLSEGGHLAHMELFGHEITAMSKSTFYFVLIVLVAVDLVQGRYQRKLLKQSEADTLDGDSSAS